jgi:exodeoxyribonuclease VII large subunit
MSEDVLPLEERLVFQVSELVDELRDSLYRDFGEIWVEGEIGSLHRSAAGHVYFDLKDDSALLRSVMFRSRVAALGFEPEEGMEVCAGGRLDVFAPRGTLQLVAESLEPSGVGALRIAFERMRARLEAEGLFDPAHKQPLPFLPRRIGLVTSKGGAAVHDFLRGLRRRGAPVEVLLCDARVQGEGAWRELARGLHLLDADPSVDVIVLARGGGSIEDLWSFNTEELVRAVFELSTPVVSAIGHEVDVVLTDLVADQRAATSTAAAELVVPDGAVLRRQLGELEDRLFLRQAASLRELSHRLDALRRGLVHPAERLGSLSLRLASARGRLGRAAASGLERRAGRLTPLGARLRQAAGSGLERRGDRLASLGGRLEALSPLGVLARGYGIVRRGREGPVVTASGQLSVGDDVHVRLAEGGLLARVREILRDT